MEYMYSEVEITAMKQLYLNITSSLKVSSIEHRIINTRLVNRINSSTKMAPTTTHHLYPPFPEDLPTAPLVSISLAKLEASDGVESQAFFNASQELGFFYLNMDGSPLGENIVSEAEQLHKLQQEFFKLPTEEKETYAREKIDSFFGYRHGDLKGLNDDGTAKRNEIYNVVHTIQKT